MTDDIEERFARAKPAPKREASRKPRLSPWALWLKDVDWPLSYQADFRPLRPGLG